MAPKHLCFPCVSSQCILYKNTPNDMISYKLSTYYKVDAYKFHTCIIEILPLLTILGYKQALGVF